MRAFVAHGARVVIADLQRSKGLNLVKELGADTVVYVHCDVTNEGDVVTAVKAALDNFGGLDVMVNNAGECRHCRCTAGYGLGFSCLCMLWFPAQGCRC